MAAETPSDTHRLALMLAMAIKTEEGEVEIQDVSHWLSQFVMDVELPEQAYERFLITVRAID